jgi:hypothetical protein
VPKYQIEMLWDCTSCETDAIGGTQDHCPNCGAAHDTKANPWYMPGDISHRNRITDARRLQMAAAGPNWTCDYCSGTQRNPDGSCLNCAGPRSEADADRASGRPVESVSRVASSMPPRAPAYDSEDPVWPPPRGNSPLLFIGGGMALLALIIGLVWMLFHKRPVDLEVTSVEWTQTVSVERYRQVAQSGWDEDMPRDAADVKNEGSRIHHYDQVLDHYETVHYTVQVEDGQDCVDVPETCYTTAVTCSPNDNGTADCWGGDEVCSGGGQSCTTRYRDDPRTREEPVYRDEPRYEDHYAWTVWRWTPQRQPSHSGRTVETSWPDREELCLNCNVGSGEQERESGRQGTYAVHLLDRDRADTFDHAPTTEKEFRRFPIGSKHPALYSIIGGLEFQLAAN